MTEGLAVIVPLLDFELFSIPGHSELNKGRYYRVYRHLVA
jgi:hypothetical protein